MTLTEQVWHEGVHAGGGKEHGRIALRDQWGRGNLGMPTGFKEAQIALDEFLAGHFRRRAGFPGPSEALARAERRSASSSLVTEIASSLADSTAFWRALPTFFTFGAALRSAASSSRTTRVVSSSTSWRRVSTCLFISLRVSRPRLGAVKRPVIVPTRPPRNKPRMNRLISKS